MALKATHKGQCQVCGAMQMLPGGFLSKHGYTTRWHFFEGVCWGAGHLPLELDKSLIQGAIERAQENAKQLTQEASRREKINDPENVVYSVYRSEWYRNGNGYRNFLGKIREVNKTLFFVFDLNGKEQGEMIHRYGKPEALALEYNQQEAERLRQKVQELDKYVAWQLDRIKRWHKKPLTPR